MNLEAERMGGPARKGADGFGRGRGAASAVDCNAPRPAVRWDMACEASSLSAAAVQAAAVPWLTVILVCAPDRAPEPCLEALVEAGARQQDLICVCPSALCPLVLERGRTLVRQGALRAFRCHACAPDQNPRALANRAVGEAVSPLALLLSSGVRLEKDSLPRLRDRLEAEAGLAGVNPLLLYPADAFGTMPEERRICHMGSVADCRGQAHYLYEGLPLGHILAARRRLFQMGHEAALLLRREDFLACGGFRPELEDLAGTDFCLRLAALRGGAFSSEPAALATLDDVFDAWKSCGLWNSLMQRGSLESGLLRPDYAAHVQADGLEYGLTPWLEESPLPHPAAEARLEGATDSPLRVWLRWRRDPQPAAFLEMLRLLPPQMRHEALRLCRELPHSLPRAFFWYAVQAQTLAAYGRDANLPLLRSGALQWRRQATVFHERLLKPALRILAESGIYACSLDDAPSAFDAWLELREKQGQAAPGIGPKLSVGAHWPDVALVMPVWNPEPGFLRAALDSVLAQSYPHWQLCVADDASSQAEIPEMLRALAARDKRVRLTVRGGNGHICRASNSALALADAPWTAFLDHDDLLAPDALLEVARLAASRPGLGFIYSDEDKVDACGVRRGPVFKAAFDPDLYDGCNYTCHLSAFASRLVHEAGGFRPGLEGSQDYDLTLRVTEKLGPEQIAHIPRILYHWRVHAKSSTACVGAKPYVLEATRRALDESVARRGLAAEAVAAGRNNFFKLLRATPPDLTCSVVLLARNAQAVAPQLWDCLAGLGRDRKSVV